VSTEAYYERQSGLVPDGLAFSGRVEKARRLLARHLSTISSRGFLIRFLDIGCGVGATGLHLAHGIGAKEIYGVDIAPSYVEAARQAGVQAERVDINTELLPFPSAYFQAVFCGEILEHLINPDHLLDEIHRVMTTDGCCVLTTPNLAGWHNRLALLIGAQPFPMDVSLRHPDAGKLLPLSSGGLGLHLRIFTYRALRSVLADHGFTIVEAIATDLSDTNPQTNLTRRLRALLAFVRPIDLILSRFPSLSPCLVFAFKKAEAR
jgi:SAM-dependent methyltransferase